MTQFQTIATKDIFVPERLRAVEEDHALAIAQSIVEHGLLNPISVRRTPAKKGFAFTLIAGAHRLRAYQINDEDQIEVLIFEADAEEGQLLEITENLFRNELSVIDRAIFVQSYRDIWEAKHGKITPGGDQRSKGQFAPLIGEDGARSCVVDLIAEEARKGFGKHVADRMGISVDSYKRLNRIGQGLHASVREAVRGTPIADSQGTLLKLAKLEPEKQRLFAAGYKESRDFDLTMRALEGGAKPKPDTQLVLLGRLMDTWRRASKDTKLEFVEHIRAFIDAEAGE